MRDHNFGHCHTCGNVILTYDRCRCGHRTVIAIDCDHPVCVARDDILAANVTTPR